MFSIPRYDSHSEDGFTLIELLVVILIIGILAAVAVPVFLNQRKQESEASVKSDLKNAASVFETELVSNKVYPTAIPESVKTSSGVTLDVKTIIDGKTGDVDERGYMRVNLKSIGTDQLSPTYTYIRITDLGRFNMQSGAPWFERRASVPVQFFINAKCKDGSSSGGGTASTLWYKETGDSWTSYSMCSDKGGAVSVTLTSYPLRSTPFVYTVDASVTITPGMPETVSKLASSPKQFCITASHENNPTNIWKYDSANGGLMQGSC